MPAACDIKVLFDRRKKRCDFSSAGFTLMLQTTQYFQSQLINIKNSISQSNILVDKILIRYFFLFSYKLLVRILLYFLVIYTLMRGVEKYEKNNGNNNGRNVCIGRLWKCCYRRRR